VKKIHTKNILIFRGPPKMIEKGHTRKKQIKSDHFLFVSIILEDQGKGEILFGKKIKFHV
jgi:hypothetical protein